MEGQVEEKKRLWRSRNDAVIAGICGGVADYLKVDPVLIRVLWIVFTFVGGGGLIAYLICWLVIPREPEELLNTGGSTGGPDDG